MSENKMCATPKSVSQTNPSRELARFAVELKIGDIPEQTLKEARRSLLNYFAVGIGGCHDRTIDIALDTYAEFAGPALSHLFGRPEKSDLLTAASLNAMGANVYDFDDTHTPTIIHPTAPVAAALLSLAHKYPINGKDLLAAFLVGVEVQCRLGNAISPYHYTRGWHITSTCAVAGVAAAAGRILGLSVDQMVWAFGSAATQAGGLVECLGTMSKSASVGNAARNGLVSAFLARNNFDGPVDPLVGMRGFIRVYGEQPDISRLTQDLGQTWEIHKNTYKPYPCGVVLNPVLDACIELSHDIKRQGIDLAHLDRIVLTGHPLLRQRTDRPRIETGRESQVCAQHGVAITLMRGQAGLAEFSDGAVQDPAVRELGGKVSFVDDDAYSVDSASVSLSFRDEQALTRHVDYAKGSVDNPLTDGELEEKLAAMCDYAGVQCETDGLARLIWTIDEMPDVSELMRMVGTVSVCSTAKNGQV